MVLSDPVDFDVPAFVDLAVSVYFPGATGPVTWHQLGAQTTYISTPGDFTAAPEMPVATTSTSRFVLADVDVEAGKMLGAVVTLGDSITDGYCSTVDANHRWPDYLSLRLNATNGNNGMAVLNQGISGNRLLHDVFGPNSLARYDRDALSQAGVTHIVVLEGINDIGLPGAFELPMEAVSADEIILVARLHRLKAPPFPGTTPPRANSSAKQSTHGYEQRLRLMQLLILNSRLHQFEVVAGPLARFAPMPLGTTNLTCVNCAAYSIGRGLVANFAGTYHVGNGGGPTMSGTGQRRTGGCLCGALRYEADGEPQYAGYCCCADCRKASGSGFIPFMGYASSAVRFSGPTRTFISKSARGTEAVRNFCPVCASLVFGGVIGESAQFTIYAGSLDDPSCFRPTIAIFTRSRPTWVVIPPELKSFEEFPC